MRGQCLEHGSKTVAHERLEARAIGRILDRDSGEVVGWLYEWNTGERAQLWRSGKRGDVVYEEMILPCKIREIDCERVPKRN